MGLQAWKATVKQRLWLGSANSQTVSSPGPRSRRERPWHPWESRNFLAGNILGKNRIMHVTQVLEQQARPERFQFFKKKFFFVWCGPFLKSFLNLLHYCLCFGFFGHEVGGSLAPWPGIKPTSPTLEGKVLTSHPKKFQLWGQQIPVPKLPYRAGLNHKENKTRMRHWAPREQEAWVAQAAMARGSIRAESRSVGSSISSMERQPSWQEPGGLLHSWGAWAGVGVACPEHKGPSPNY